MQSSDYRPEIDGLRALSVVAVVLFHLDVAPFTGGYVGVDVFFVISGYLITRIIATDIEAGQFSLVRFYARRIRRLFPALFFTVLATFIAAVFWFPPETLRGTALDSLYVLASLSNVHFWRGAHEYFAPQASFIPLLHTWSLGVEDQFYLVWPAALLAIARLRRNWAMPVVILAAAAVSLALCEIFIRRDPPGVFFLTPFRIFELSIGALCVWTERWRLQQKIWNEIVFGAGLAAILVSVFIFSSRTPFPGVYALLPCLGAALIIQIGPCAGLSRILSHKAAVGIGLISYSLYLCHWPILVFSRYVFGDTDSLLVKAGLVVLIFAVGTLMYFFIEKPFRRQPGAVTGRTFSYLLARTAAVAAVVAVPAFLAYAQGGWVWRLDAAQRERLELQKFGYAPCVTQGKACTFGDVNGPLGLTIIGDSYAQQLVAAFDPLLSSRGLRGEIRALGACTMIDGLEKLSGQPLARACKKFREETWEWLKTNQAPIVVNHAWSAYRPGKGAAADERRNIFRDSLRNFIGDFGEGGRAILLVGAQVAQRCRLTPERIQPAPLAHAEPPPCRHLAAADAKRSVGEIDALLLEAQQQRPGSVAVLRPVDFLCGDDCPAQRNGVWLYQDNGHMTVAGSRYLGTQARNVIEGFIGAGRNK